MIRDLGLSINSGIVFGPVPSRRLGRSLGVNNIKPKVCTYSCVYCQIGRTLRMSVQRKLFYKPGVIIEAVSERLKAIGDSGEKVDYVTFVPDGEPTLDLNLGKEIEGIKYFGVQVAVISNSSLIWLEDVRNDLLKADYVSLKVDAVTPEVWLRINRPHKSLSLPKILEGITLFSEEFDGVLTTETMLVDGINDSLNEAQKIAEFLARIKPQTAYIAAPTRPPTESWVRSASPKTINEFHTVFKDRGINAELLVSFEGTDFSTTGNIRKDVLSIASVHPLREDALKELIRKANADWSVIDELIKKGDLVVMNYQGKKYYLRNLGVR